MKKIGKLRISAVRNESFKDSKYAKANVGESIQSVAMELIYDKCGIERSRIIRIDQCDVKKYCGEDIILPLRLPLSRENVDDYFPLNPCVHPFFISLHLHDNIFDGRRDLIEYFKKYEPIGCRDEVSCDFFRMHGIESYIMGCYTLAFPVREGGGIPNKYFIVDASQALLNCIPLRILDESEQLTHAIPYMKYPVTPEEDQRLEDLARDYLRRYREEARMVITSRLHVAAPCIAMGVPVILGTDNADFRYAWIDRFLPIYQSDDYSGIEWTPSIVDISYIQDRLLNLFDGILNHEEMRGQTLKEMDFFYRQRRKTEYYKLFRNRLKSLNGKYRDNSFTYAIWGAGNHSLFAHQLISELYPNAMLVAVVDRFKTGTKFGVPIIHGDEIVKYKPDHICISTKPGLEDALQGCKAIYGAEYQAHYTIISSQQVS